MKKKNLLIHVPVRRFFCVFWMCFYLYIVTSVIGAVWTPGYIEFEWTWFGEVRNEIQFNHSLPPLQNSWRETTSRWTWDRNWNFAHDFLWVCCSTHSLTCVQTWWEGVLINIDLIFYLRTWVFICETIFILVPDYWITSKGSGRSVI